MSKLNLMKERMFYIFGPRLTNFVIREGRKAYVYGYPLKSELLEIRAGQRGIAPVIYEALVVLEEFGYLRQTTYDQFKVLDGLKNVCFAQEMDTY